MGVDRRRNTSVVLALVRTESDWGRVEDKQARQNVRLILALGGPKPGSRAEDGNNNQTNEGRPSILVSISRFDGVESRRSCTRWPWWLEFGIWR